MGIHSLKAWSDVVKLHPDVESGELTEAVFAIDLGAIATDDTSAPKVYRDADAFFGATYPTKDLQRMLEEVLSSLAGKGNFNRVLKLRSPFGGGKSHTLASLLHAARSRKSLNQITECKKFPDPGSVDVAVFDGEKFTAIGGKQLEGGKTVNTIWGWLAWQLGEKAFALWEKHDRDRVAPAGDEIKELLSINKRPVLFLLDEVLKYMEGAAAVPVLESTLQRQAKKFLQDLTVEIASSKNAVLVYSLQWSAREALGNVALLEELDKLTSRKDQVREPVTGDEILAVVKRRLLGAEPDETTASQVAVEYSKAVGNMLESHAEAASDRQDAQEQALQLKNRMKSAYPFHPALIDVMNTRWTSVDGFQRTRGALRFLASCLHSSKVHGHEGRSILGPAEIPLSDPEVVRAMMKDLDPKQDYDPVLRHDIIGPNARAKRIDERLSKETPALSSVRPATRLATAILAYSFGGLKREGGEGVDSVPPGITESELLAACIGPDFDSITASAVLSELRNTCLYLHYDGVRYCFKKDANVTKLIEDAEQEVARDADGVRERIKTVIEERLAGKPGAIVWKDESLDIPDKEPVFQLDFLSIEFAALTQTKQDEKALLLFTKYGDKPRKYRNGLGVAVPNKKPIETLRRAVRYLMAIERVDGKKKQHRLTTDQLDQLRERRRTEEAALETSLRALYSSVWLPRMNSGSIEVEKIEVGGRPLQATDLFGRAMELLTSIGTPKVHGSLHPKKIIDRLKLDEKCKGVKVSEVVDAFFGFLEPPRILSAIVLSKAISKGIQERMFGFVTGTPNLNPAGKYDVNPVKVAFGRITSDEEIDLDTGFLIIPEAIPALEQPGIPPSSGGVIPPATPGASSGVENGSQPPEPGKRTRSQVSIAFSASREQVFKAFPAIANLAEKADDGKISISIEGTSSAGFESGWFRNAVEEPLDEANIDGLTIS